jgi:hypothetical protein
MPMPTGEEKTEQVNQNSVSKTDLFGMVANKVEWYLLIV